VPLSQPDIQVKHRWTDKEIIEFCRVLELGARLITPTSVVSAALTRDVTDTKWVALALDADADYLVTKDRRHLERLKEVGRTRNSAAAEVIGHPGEGT
jgi:predicted nucleic acid-binding protein